MRARVGDEPHQFAAVAAAKALSSKSPTTLNVKAVPGTFGFVA